MSMIYKLIHKIKSELRKIVNGNRFSIRYLQNTYYLNTTYGHPLKSHLKHIKLYDRFLPHLVKSTGMGVIDIGSNVGDTMTLIKSIADVPMICVEPNKTFLSVLKKNITDNNFRNITVYPYAISNSRKHVTIELNGLSSTGNITNSVANKESVLTKSFSEFVDEIAIDISAFKIIKIDTDGFDWDCLESLANYIRLNKNHQIQFIFYEHQTYLNNLGFSDPDILYRENKYIEVLMTLELLGFNHYYLFDNFGTFTFETSSLNDLKKLVEYVRRTMTENSVATIYFFDILVCNNKYCNVVEKALIEYKDKKFEVK